jgi:hypothetical protein
LRKQVAKGRLTARLIGKTYVVTPDEIQRYRQASLGQQGKYERKRDAK